MNKLLFILLFYLDFFCFQLIGQGLEVSPLEYSNFVSNELMPFNRNVDSLNIPFFEDFSYQSKRPDARLWEDKSAMVNLTLAIRPPGFGVATLDGIGANGNPYAGFVTHGSADTLTSKPFSWNLLPSDSVYMSFYFQPGGLGNFPEFIDSLILEFYNPEDSLWNRVWGTKGEDYPQLTKEFELKMVPIVDSAYLKPGFQFRFRNFAQLNGSWDLWHLDYIRINAGRNFSDTLLNDVAYMYEPHSIIDTYQSAPMWHFQTNPIENMLEFFNLSLTSLRLGAVGVDYGFDYYNAQGVKVDSVTSDPQGPVAYRNEYVMNEAVKYVFADPGTESTHYDLEYFITNNLEDDVFRNDTIRFQQVFSNYYALDDGTAEARINLNNNGGGFVAQRFEFWTSDTLKAVQIQFNRTSAPSSSSFYLMIWAAGSNQPGSILYEQEVTYPEASELSTFSTFMLNVPLPLAAGTYYIGWAQTNNAELNIGFDRNLNNNNRIYYNFDGNWYPYAAAEGTLMIRPVLRYPYDIFVGNPKTLHKKEEFSVFPNPAKNFIRIRSNSNSTKNWIIFDVHGRVVLSDSGSTLDDIIDIRSLNTGMYMIGIWYKDGVYGSAKFCVSGNEH